MSSEENLNVTNNFIRTIINKDLKDGKNQGRVATRFPPEPNGYLHIGHAKSICLNFTLAKDYNGICNLRFDDTNPAKEEVEYVDSIKDDIKWLGFEWTNLFYASDYFEQIYNYAVQLIKDGKAYVDSLTAEEIKQYRGTLTEAGKNSPYRDRSVEENLTLFEKMRNGEFEEGACVLRAKIDMSSPNINMRDPALYRIKKAHHHKTGDKWCIYPMYDFAHCISDAIEGITHSICTLEFEDHRPLYDWCLDELKTEYHPQQIEFAKLGLNYTVMGKRYLREMVETGVVSGWDDPRMPTISAFRRKGYTPESIRNFCEMVGVAKSNNTVDFGQLEFCIREDLNKKATRVMAVLNPIKLVITNYPDDLVEELETENNPEDENSGKRKVPFSKVLYIEKDDFEENPPKGYHRLFVGNEVRLKSAYYVKCTGFEKNEQGEITEVHCTYDPETKSGSGNQNLRKVKGTIHWVSAEQAVSAEIRLYNHLFTVPNPNNVEEGYRSVLNPESLIVLKNCKLEPSLVNAKLEDRFQFVRNGYFCVDSRDSKEGSLVFNRVVGLKDSWAKEKAKNTK
ncbi:MAG: glutamine--tRNA ligase/YqeY domain fusion protein [Candidatus Sericytochromatia bacterium]